AIAGRKCSGRYSTTRLAPLFINVHIMHHMLQRGRDIGTCRCLIPERRVICDLLEGIQTLQSSVSDPEPL
ncbi:unnamed protein product, partial [Gadus morhua 'NCC']